MRRSREESTRPIKKRRRRMTGQRRLTAGEARVLGSVAQADKDEREWARIRALSLAELNHELPDRAIDPAPPRARREADAGEPAWMLREARHAPQQRDVGRGARMLAAAAAMALVTVQPSRNRPQHGTLDDRAKGRLDEGGDADAQVQDERRVASGGLGRP